jgi:hypothetical protein
MMALMLLPFGKCAYSSCLATTAKQVQARGQPRLFRARALLAPAHFEAYCIEYFLSMANGRFFVLLALARIGQVVAGVNPKDAQTLARHKSIDLTINRYTHVRLADSVAALDKLPPLKAGGAAQEGREEGRTG